MSHRENPRRRRIEAWGLTQAKPGEILGIRQPHVSALMRSGEGMCSVARLVEFYVRGAGRAERPIR
jgi:predicted XRE-type DNA-binding protein